MRTRRRVQSVDEGGDPPCWAHLYDTEEEPDGVNDAVVDPSRRPRDQPRRAGDCRRPMSSRVWLRRAYDAPTRNDGYRVLIDRFWPRGTSRADSETR